MGGYAALHHPMVLLARKTLLLSLDLFITGLVCVCLCLCVFVTLSLHHCFHRGTLEFSGLVFHLPQEDLATIEWSLFPELVEYYHQFYLGVHELSTYPMWEFKTHYVFDAQISVCLFCVENLESEEEQMLPFQD